MQRILVSLAMAAMAAAACTGSSGSNQTVSAPSEAPTTGGSPSAAQPLSESRPIDPRKGGLEIGFGEFAITLEAKTVRAWRRHARDPQRWQAGPRLRDEIRRGGGSNSGDAGGRDPFKIEAVTFGPDDIIRIKANLPAGDYEIECYVANHEALGMRTLLRVRPGAPFVTPKAPAQGEVLIEGFRFNPGTIELKAGSKLAWKNGDPTAHTVIAKDGSFRSEPLPSGKGFGVTFDRPGQFSYFCAIHPRMTGTVRVTG
jgi:hypothetical protein